jgi:hypothetical protein
MVGDILDGVRCVETHLVWTAHIYMSVSAESVPFVSSADDWNSYVPQRPAERTRHPPPTGLTKAVKRRSYLINATDGRTYQDQDTSDKPPATGHAQAGPSLPDWWSTRSRGSLKLRGVLAVEVSYVFV